MRGRWRIALLVASVAVGVVLFLVLRGEEQGDEEAQPPPPTATQPQATTTVETQPRPPAPLTVRINSRAAGLTRISVPRGRQVVLLVTGEPGAEVHLHGYDVLRRIPATGPPGFRFARRSPAASRSSSRTRAGRSPISRCFREPGRTGCARSRDRGDSRPARSRLALLLRSRARARCVVRGARRAVEGAAAGADGRAALATRIAAGAVVARPAVRPRLAQRGVARAGGRRRPGRRRLADAEPGADVRLRRLLARHAAPVRPAGRRVASAEPLASGGRCRRVT